MLAPYVLANVSSPTQGSCDGQACNSPSALSISHPKQGGDCRQGSQHNTLGDWPGVQIESSMHAHQSCHAAAT